MNVWLPTVRAGSGVDIFTERLASGLQKSGIKTTVTWFNQCFELIPGVLKVVSPPVGTDIVHANSWNAFAFRHTRIKTVVTVHLCVHDPLLEKYKSSLQSAYHKFLVSRFESLSMEAADVVTAVSRYTSGIVGQVFRRACPEVVYNGIDTDLFNVGRKAATNGKFTLLFVGNPTSRKGFDLLQPVMEKLGPDYVLNYTSGFRRRPLSQTATNMHDLGRLEADALIGAYHDCDALLFPTRAEGFGYSVCEAMACGKPVIASDNSSMPELVKRNETGFLCPTDDVDAFVRAVRTLADSPDMARQMGQSGREYVLQNFTQEKMINNYIRLYEQILDL